MADSVSKAILTGVWKIEGRNFEARCRKRQVHKSHSRPLVGLSISSLLASCGVMSRHFLRFIEALE